GDSGWRIGYQHAPLGHGGPWMRENLWKPQFAGRPAYLLPPVCNIEDGPSGLTYYPGTGLTPEYAGHFFITHFKGSIARSGIQTYTIKPQGATFTPTSSQQFMGGVLPTDVTFGPDGVLYLADWVDGWPKSNKGRIYGITPVKPDPAQAKVSADLAKLLAEGFSQRSNKELVALLAHPDRRARLEAQLELAARGSSSVADFSKVANDKSAAPLARLHAVWGLTQIGRTAAHDSKPDRKVLAAFSTLSNLLGDGDPEVRAQAAKGLGDMHAVKTRPALEKLLTDAEPRVRFFAAQSLGKIGDPASAEPLIALLRANNDQDAYLRFVAAHALSKLGADAALAKAAKDPSAAVRLGVLLAYRYSQDPAIATFLADSDAYIVREAAEAINDAPIEPALPALAGKLASAPPADEALVVRALNANFRAGGAPRARVLANYALNDRATPEMRAEALKQLGLWGKTPARDRVVGIFRPMAARPADDAVAALQAQVAKLLANGIPQPVQLAALDAVASLELRSASPALVALVGDEQAAEAVRGNALKVLDGFGGDDVLKAVASAEKSKVPALRLAALQILAHRAPDRALPVIKRFASNGSEAEQRAAFEAMGQLQPAQAAPLLIGALDRLAAGKVSPGAQVELLDAVAKSEVPAVKTRWEKQQAAWNDGRNPLAGYASALQGGDAARGAREFYGNEVLPCARCHKVDGNGGEAGPDLSRI
ncbi:MAG TPA: HEAT repeat domain-containing protein, partial [Steroidobacteraceae bacterium]|nr:HEAT repeat domain-containing protein [Steroidobacteraceae bacterium]